jgi:hypothetical protein
VEQRSRVAPWAPPRAQRRLAELESEPAGLGLDEVTRLVDGHDPAKVLQDTVALRRSIP